MSPRISAAPERDLALQGSHTQFLSGTIELFEGDFGFACDTNVVFLGTAVGQNVLIGRAEYGTPTPGEAPIEGACYYDAHTHLLRIFHDATWHTYTICS